MKHSEGHLILTAVIARTLLPGAAIARSRQKNPVSNQNRMAIRPDSRSINGWRVAFVAHCPFRLARRLACKNRDGTENPWWPNTD